LFLIIFYYSMARINSKKFYSALAENKFDTAGTEMNPSEVIEYLKRNPQATELVRENEPYACILVKFKLFNKALTGDFNCMKFIMEKIARSEDQIESESFYAEIPVIRNGEVTDEFEEIQL